MEYDSRERIMAALDHREPDRVPIAFGGLHDSIHLHGHRALKSYLGLEGGDDPIQDPFQQIVYPDPRLLERFRSDILPVYAKPAAPFRLEFKDEGSNTTYTDEWGTKYRKPRTRVSTTISINISSLGKQSMRYELTGFPTPPTPRDSRACVKGCRDCMMIPTRRS